MKIAFFDTHEFDRLAFEAVNNSRTQNRVEFRFLEARLSDETSRLAAGCTAVCAFVNDRIEARTAELLTEAGVKLIALRCAGFNNVDIDACRKLGLRITRVPAYSPHAVAEHAMGLVLSLNRKIHRSVIRVRELNFSLDGLVGFDLFGKTVGIIGTGKIGTAFAEICAGFGMNILAFDPFENSDLVERCRVKYVDLPKLFRECDIISLHAPLSPQTYHLIDDGAIKAMKPGVMIINTSRGALIDSAALNKGLKSRHVGYAGLDVYEEEEGVFFKDLSQKILEDDVLARLLTFPNVIITSHQAFLTREALANIAATTLDSIAAFENGETLKHEVLRT